MDMAPDIWQLRLTGWREGEDEQMAGQTLYLECTSGISGDMTVAALLDLGADEQVLRKALESLPADGFQIQISRVKKSGLDVCDFQVLLDGEHENHDHDMAYLHGRSHPHIHEGGGQDASHTHSEEFSHPHDREEKHHPHVHGAHEHRNLGEILEIIEKADMTRRAKALAAEIFQILAQAEAKAHGVPVGQVHFHEVGAVDSIVDILSAAVCLDNLEIAEVIVPRLCEGCGTIRCQHGILPIPVPAVLNIVQEHGLHLHITQVEGELVTPTGAAIAAAVRTSEQLPERFTVLKTGLGAGKRTYDCPGFLRAVLIQPEKPGKSGDTICKLEANIDDSTGEMLGYAMELLFQAGARDVHYVPIFMKKNRPAYQLNVICEEKDASELEKIIFRETTTIGIRRMQVERSVMHREICQVQTSLGEAAVKVCTWDGQKRIYPEYDSVAQLAQKHGLPYQQVYRILAGQAEKAIVQAEI